MATLGVAESKRMCVQKRSTPPSPVMWQEISSVSCQYIAMPQRVLANNTRMKRPFTISLTEQFLNAFWFHPNAHEESQKPNEGILQSRALPRTECSLSSARVCACIKLACLDKGGCRTSPCTSVDSFTFPHASQAAPGHSSDCKQIPILMGFACFTSIAEGGH